jgi:murein DD-endopeptidase MepM/ murein hydrolase activator NlpD
MSKSESFFLRLRKFLFNKIKINALNPVTYEPYFGIEISRITLFSLIFVIFLIGFTLSYTLISYTPLSGLLPDRVRSVDKQNLEEQYIRVDSLMAKLELQDRYIEDVKKIILGEPLSMDSVPEKKQTTSAIESVDLPKGPSEAEKEFAQKIQDDLNAERGFKGQDEVLSGVFFFSPVKGKVSQKMTKEHPGVDIITREDELVKSVLDGMIIFSDWSTKNGRTIIINHGNKFISVYKHNSVLLKRQGEFVRAGDPIAIVGNSGENTTGPHLHFELIFEGKYVNPLNYISFK